MVFPTPTYGPLAISSFTFSLKNKKHDVFTWKPQTFLKFTGFKKNRKSRECENARAKERECKREGKFPRPHTFAISSLAFFKRSQFQTRFEFSFENLASFSNKKARLEIASGLNGISYLPGKYQNENHFWPRLIALCFIDFVYPI